MIDSCSVSTKQARDLWISLVNRPVTQQNAASLLKPLISLLPRHDVDTQALVRTTLLVLASQESTKELFEESALMTFSRLQRWADPSDTAVHLFHLHLRCNLNTSLALERRCKQIMVYVLDKLDDSQWWSRESHGLFPLLESLVQQNIRNGGLWPLDQQALKLLQEKIKKNRDPSLLYAVPPSPASAKMESWLFGEPLHRASATVARFYEHHPYPRWDRLDLSPLNNGLRSHLSRAVGSPAAAAIDCEPKCLIVLGCGTGREALAWAAALPDCHVVGIDLSATSLAYASGMAQRLGLNNVEWHQEDLLNLPSHSAEYDLVIACGVLHHLPDPAEGLEVATRLARPGGLIKLALYSAPARRPIIRIRKLLLDIMGCEPSSERLAVARSTLIENFPLHPELIHLQRIQDFFDLDGCWDLFFNPCESAFSLPAVEQLLALSRLRFLGFEWDDQLPLFQFRALFPSDRDALNLYYWSCFESRFPDTFLGMYRFWCQRAAC